MIISADVRTYLLYKLKKLRKQFPQFSELIESKTFINKGISGPQNFLSELLISIEENKLAKITPNLLSSNIHLLNFGFYSKIWHYVPLKPKRQVLLRLDGIGIDSDNNYKKKDIEKNTLKLIERSSYLIYQSSFCKNCFNDIYGSLPRGEVIINGANKDLPISELSINIQNNINTYFKKKYFVVAGRYNSRKRIQEVINEFNNFEIGNLIVLSNVPEKMKFKNRRILYLGMINPYIARYIISNSISLIHFDRYDWCPNIVVNAVFDGIPIICSNFGGTPEIADKSSFIVDEFPKDLPHNLEGINFAKKVDFPSLLFKERIIDVWNIEPNKKPNKSYDIKYTSKKYINSADMLMKLKVN